MFREPEGKRVFETDNLAAAPTNADEVKIYIQKCYGSRDTSGTLSSVNPPVSVVATKPLSSNMDSIYFLSTKIPSLAFKCDDITI